MTNLYNGQLVELLGGNAAAYNPEVRAFSYALLQEKHRIMDYAKKTRTASMINELPEPILDVLAVELRSPYYNDAASIDEKRDVIRSSLLWAYKAGTAEAMEQLIKTLFGTGQVVEWFDFDPNDGEIVPGEFDIETGAEMEDPQSYMARIGRIIDRVKNARSHLRKVRFLRYVHNRETPKVLPQSYPVRTIGNQVQIEDQTVAPERTAAGTLAIPAVTIR